MRIGGPAHARIVEVQVALKDIVGHWRGLKDKNLGAWVFAPHVHGEHANIGSEIDHEWIVGKLTDTIAMVVEDFIADDASVDFRGGVSGEAMTEVQALVPRLAMSPRLTNRAITRDELIK